MARRQIKYELKEIGNWSKKGMKIINKENTKSCGGDKHMVRDKEVLCEKIRLPDLKYVGLRRR